MTIYLVRYCEKSQHSCYCQQKKNSDVCFRHHHFPPRLEMCTRFTLDFMNFNILQNRLFVKYLHLAGFTFRRLGYKIIEATKVLSLRALRKIEGRGNLLNRVSFPTCLLSIAFLKHKVLCRKFSRG